MLLIFDRKVFNYDATTVAYTIIYPAFDIYLPQLCSGFTIVLS